jgi:hypothetical protein
MQNIAVDTRYSRLVTLIISQDVLQKIGAKARVISLEIRDVKRSVQGPVVFPKIEHLTDCAVPSGYNAWRCRLSLTVTTGDPGGRHHWNVAILALRIWQVVATLESEHISEMGSMPAHTPISSKFS